MTNQEAFTQIVQHLRTQGAPSSGQKEGDGNWCYYRHPDGIRRCGVGVLIQDDEYTTRLENKAVSMIYGLVPSLKDLNIHFLNDIQLAHDLASKTRFAKDMEIAYCKIALQYHLVIPPHPCVPSVEAQSVTVQECQAVAV